MNTINRSNGNRTAIFLLIFAVITCSPAFADGQFGADSDILGFKLSMTQAEAKDYATKNFPNSQLVMLPVTFTESGYSVSTVAGFMLFDKENPKPGITEVVKIVFDPNKDSSDIIAISRVTDFTDAAKNGKSVLTTTAIDSVKAKYGNPDIQKTSGTINYLFIWGPKKNELKILFPANGFSGLWQMPFPVNYFGENISQISEDLAESAAQNDFVLPLNGFVERARFAGDRAPIDSSEQIGIMLQIQILGAGDTVYQITERLMDCTKGVDAFRALGASINAGIDAVKKAKHDQISGNTYSP